MVQSHQPRSVNSPRIVFGVTDSLSIRLLGRIPKRLSEEGWEVYVVADLMNPVGFEKFPSVNYRHIRMVRVPKPLLDLVSLFSWVSLLRELKPSVVSVGTPKAGFLGIAASYVTKVRHRVYVLRGLRLQSSSGASWWLLWFFEWATSQMSTRILAVSRSLAAEYLRVRLSQSNKITVLGPGSSHGVNTNTRHLLLSGDQMSTEREKLGIAVGIPVLGFVGRVTADKGAEFLHYTRRYLIANHCDHEMVIIGPNEQSEGDLDALLNFPRKTRYLGYLSNPLECMAVFDVLLLPSKREGFPNVILESASLGIPTVTTGVTGSIDAVVHDWTGLIAYSNSKLEFAKKVHRLATSPNERLFLGRNAQQWVERNFRQELIEELNVNFYQAFMGFDVA